MPLGPEPCLNPDLPLLRRLVLDRLSPEVFGEVERHLEICSNCQDACEAISVDPLEIPGFQLEDLVGQGGMGTVYRAFDTTLNRHVAVKIMRPGMSDERFLRESQIAGQLQHPAVPSVHQTGTLTDGRPFLVMKLIKGDTLESLQNRESRIADFLKVCEAVGYAHARGVIHRDLKPSNVMVGALGEVQVMDWGLAKLMTETDAACEQIEHATKIVAEEGVSTGAGVVLGTRAYMPPEQARGLVEEVDQQSDVFSLGGILCYLLTGNPPYAGERDLPKRAKEADLREAFGRLDSCGADEPLISLAKRCLSPKKGERPADGEALAEELTAYLAEVHKRNKDGRVAPGGCPPRAPTDPDVPNSGIRLLKSSVRCGAEHGMDQYRSR